MKILKILSTIPKELKFCVLPPLDTSEYLVRDTEGLCPLSALYKHNTGIHIRDDQFHEIARLHYNLSLDETIAYIGVVDGVPDGITELRKDIKGVLEAICELKLP